MTEAITCPRCGGNGELESYEYKGVDVDPGDVREAKQALRDAFVIDHRLPETPASEDIVVALAQTLPDVEFEGPEPPA